jgi:type IV secretion system protein VirB10
VPGISEGVVLPEYPEERTRSYTPVRDAGPTPQQIRYERLRQAQLAPLAASVTRSAGSADIPPVALPRMPEQPAAAMGPAGFPAQPSPQPVADEYQQVNAQDRKRVFLAAAKAASRSNYLGHTRVPQVGAYEIKAGWEIPAVMEQALNSDLPGEIKALVSQNVYDTATGQYLLIPQGARLIGKYSSDVSYGQDGVQAVWDRIIFPDGSSINLEGMQALDAHGQAGMRHDVDRHYWRTFGMAALTSVFVAAYELTQRGGYGSGGQYGYPSAGDTASAAVGREMSRTGAQITRRNLSVQPTIKVPIGYKFVVRVNRDILFQEPYAPSRPEDAEPKSSDRLRARR